jgi:adenylate cyclase class IV
MQSVEFKAELRDRALAILLAQRHGASLIREMQQRDTYFKVADGRLRRREVEGDPVEYAFYHRLDRIKPTVCHFTVYDEEQAAERFGTRPLPIWITVEKTRALYLMGAVTISFDSVVGLGGRADFFEATALVMPSQHLGVCHKLIADAREAVAPALGEPVAPGYAELVAAEVGQEQV